MKILVVSDIHGSLLHAQKADMIGVGRAIMQNPGWAKAAMSE